MFSLNNPKIWLDFRLLALDAGSALAIVASIRFSTRPLPLRLELRFLFSENASSLAPVGFSVMWEVAEVSPVSLPGGSAIIVELSAPYDLAR